jgi:hypothetical protein
MPIDSVTMAAPQSSTWVDRQPAVRSCGRAAGLARDWLSQNGPVQAMRSARSQEAS